MEKLLYISSELFQGGFEYADCANQHQRIKNVFKEKEASEILRIDTQLQPDYNQILELLKSNPDYVHYCGHGNNEGEFLYQNALNLVRSFGTESMKTYLGRNRNLKLLFVGSCHSSVLVEKLKLLADVSLGFVKTISPNEINEYAAVFYEELARTKEASKAYEFTNDRIKERLKLQPFFCTKKENMEAVKFDILELRENLTDLNVSPDEISDIIAKIDSALNNINDCLSDNSLFSSLINENDFKNEILLFGNMKKGLVAEISQKVSEGLTDTVYKNKLKSCIRLLFDCFEDGLLVIEDGTYTEDQVGDLLKLVKKSDLKKAMNLLVKSLDSFENSSFQRHVDARLRRMLKIIS